MCSSSSTISVQSSANLCKRLIELETDVREMEQFEKEQNIEFNLDYDQDISSKQNRIDLQPTPLKSQDESTKTNGFSIICKVFYFSF